MSTVNTSLHTDQYELTMVQAALRSGAADVRTVFEVFSRSLPKGRRYGVPAASVAYVEIGGPHDERRVGFGGP